MIRQLTITMISHQKSQLYVSMQSTLLKGAPVVSFRKNIYPHCLVPHGWFQD